MEGGIGRRQNVIYLSYVAALSSDILTQCAIRNRGQVILAFRSVEKLNREKGKGNGDRMKGKRGGGREEGRIWMEGGREGGKEGVRGKAELMKESSKSSK